MSLHFKPVIVAPDDHPALLAGTPAEQRLRMLGELSLHGNPLRGTAELIQRCREADIVVNVYSRTGFTDEVLAQLPQLKLISRAGTGLDGLDLDACRRRGIAVTHLRGNDADEVAEHSIALMLAVLRRIPETDRALRAGTWTKDYIRGARGRVLGIVGLGAIGSRTAQLGRALGMNVLAWSPGADAGRAAASGAAWAELDDLLHRSDVVSLHLRLSPDTQGLIDARRIGLMKHDAVLVNTARAGLVEHGAMIDALNERRIAGAGLDVFHTEPLPPDDPLLALPNVVLTPHSGGYMAEVMARAVNTTVQNVENWLNGAPTNLAVDPRQNLSPHSAHA